MEDGFSTVSQVSYSEHKESSNAQKLEGGISNTSLIWSKLFKINFTGEVTHEGKHGENETTQKEKVHTNVSLLSKLRTYLDENEVIKSDFEITQIQIGDFIEVEGELQKNPLIDFLDRFVDMFRMAEIFPSEAQLGEKTQAKQKKRQEQNALKQIQSFASELKHSGTVDFILSNEKSTVVLSAQEQYLSNDNISEILGGRFRVLGKVIAVCKDDSESIDLFRKTILSILSDEQIKETFSALQDEEIKQYNFPTLKTKIDGPAVIIIPIAIYA